MPFKHYWFFFNRELIRNTKMIMALYLLQLIMKWRYNTKMIMALYLLQLIYEDDHVLILATTNIEVAISNQWLLGDGPISHFASEPMANRWRLYDTLGKVSVGLPTAKGRYLGAIDTMWASRHSSYADVCRSRPTLARPSNVSKRSRTSRVWDNSGLGAACITFHFPARARVCGDSTIPIMWNRLLSAPADSPVF